MLKPLIALYFFVLAAIQLGLLIGLFHYHRSRNLVRPSPYWMGSLIANISALIVFGFGVIFIDNVEKPAFNFTIANTLFYVAAIAQWLFCRSLSEPISRRVDLVAKFSVVAFFMVFELLRWYGNFEIRTIYMVSLALLLFSSQIYQLHQIRKVNASPQLTYLQYATMIELGFAVCRLLVLMLWTISIHQVEQLPQILIFFTIAQFVANTVAYIAIGSYWTEKMALSSVAISDENEVIKKLLLLERDELIASLLKANKTAATGALSASIAHELNQPITAISLNTEYLKLKMDRGGDNPLEIKDAILNIEQDNQRISRIVSTLRNIFKQDQAELTPVNLDQLIQDLMPIIAPLARDSGIQLHLSLNAAHLVHMNSNEFSQAILNLINNAIQSLSNASTQDKRIDITTHLTPQSIQLSVADNGVGVSHELRSNLFNLMSSNKKDGMGLGLWLTKHIVDRHQGTITYQTSQYGGAEFSINLPLKPI
jgi:signal transduction histidine kinase